MTIVNPENEHHLQIGNNNEWLSIKSSTIVELEENLVVYFEDGPVTLTVKISADLNTIQREHHEVFLNVLTSKYLGRVSFGDNPFSVCKPTPKKRWYQFWK